MRPLCLMEIAAATDGSCAAGIGAPGGGSISAVFTDSRNWIKGGLFVALRGDRFDGHDYIQSLEGTGTAAVLCERPADCSIPQIVVRDTRRALLRLAAYYRSLFDIPVVALTGSVGKTTTKDMIHCVLSTKFNTLKTRGNHNNEIGVPLTLLELDASHRAAVIELGMNRAGEISLLSETVRPDIALITNIGVSHIENLGSRENILAAKLEILSGMRPGSRLILNGGDELLSSADTKGFDTYYYGIDSRRADMRATDIFEENGNTEFLARINGISQRVAVPAAGVHNVYNALAACLAGHLLGVPLADAAEGLRAYVPSGMRQRINSVCGITVIEDCYNSSPDSVKAAIGVLRSMKANKKIAVLGDMLELGAYSETAHSLTGEYAAGAKIDALLAYGAESAETAKAASVGGVKTVYGFTDGDTLAGVLAGIAGEGDAVLFKASRGMRLEDVMDKFYQIIRNKGQSSGM